MFNFQFFIPGTLYNNATRRILLWPLQENLLHFTFEKWRNKSKILVTDCFIQEYWLRF